MCFLDSIVAEDRYPDAPEEKEEKTIDKKDIFNQCQIALQVLHDLGVMESVPNLYQLRKMLFAILKIRDQVEDDFVEVEELESGTIMKKYPLQV
jgi:hypothetical protein